MTLPLEYQLVLTLRDSLNLTFEQIARIMMLPQRSVRALWLQAKALTGVARARSASKTSGQATKVAYNKQRFRPASSDRLV